MSSLDEITPPGEVLKKLRRKNLLTQAKLGKVAGIRQHRIAELESGKKGIGREVAERLGKALNVLYQTFL